VEWLRQRYEVVHSPDIFRSEGYFAGSDERRLEELDEAIRDESIDAILCARGGFGTTRLLPGIEIESIRAANKLVVGFSDITALHSLWAGAGVRSVHAPMVAALGSASDDIRDRWIEAIESHGSPREWKLDRIDSEDSPDGDPVRGRLFGGNLAVLAALNGTPFKPPLDDTILFLEAVGERPYRIDRMLTTMGQSGWFDSIRGIVLGAFTEGEPGPDGVTAEGVFESHFAGASFPVLSGLSAGHIGENEPLPFGATTCIAGDRFAVGD
jgi:muramoyltetrapeptide carboxypeptidase